MRQLTEQEIEVIERRGTERAFSGKYNQHNAVGTYHCKRCDAPLYRSENKFDAHCGWPAFDEQIAGAVVRSLDADGQRIEITCQACGGHLGHVFDGEQLTANNVRHCVNSISLQFYADKRPTTESHYQLATLGAGCFWCSEAVFSRLNGVIAIKAGYAGGRPEDATYRAVSGGTTAHAEVVNITFDPSVISYINLLQVFFQSHDPTSYHRQGNDVGPQYRSVIFTHCVEQAQLADEMMNKLNLANIYANPIVTQVSPFTGFYAAEQSHQDYFPSIHSRLIASWWSSPNLTSSKRHLRRC